MDRHSLRFKLSLLVATLFVASNAIIFVLLGPELDAIEDRSHKSFQENHLGIVATKQQAAYATLSDSDIGGPREAELKAYVIAQFKTAQYFTPDQRAFALILDGKGIVVAHPTEPAGSTALADKAFAAQIVALKEGDFVGVDGNGTATWYITKRFAPWDWQLIYSMPLDVKYANANRIRRSLMAIMAGSILFTVILFFFALNRITRPIAQLTAHTREIAQGNWGKKLRLNTRDEIGVLSQNFNLMQDAVHEKIEELDATLALQREEIVRREQTEEKLRASEARLALATDVAGMGVFDFDIKNDVLNWDDRLLEIYGVARDDFTGNHAAWKTRVHPDDLPRIMREREQRMEGDRPYYNEFRVVTPGGEIRHIEAYAVVMRDDHDRPIQMLGVNRDVTERRTTDNFIKRSQKMEAIGQISGGIAHDFNNILGILLGNLELIACDLEGDDDLQQRIQTAIRSCERAAELTRQLLNFSRSEATDPKATNINSQIENMKAIITRSLTPQVDVDYHLAADLWLTEIDTGDFEDALLNAVLNAKDAMQGVGKLLIETANTTLDEHYCRMNPSVQPGDYVQLAVSDTGTGISSDILDRIFDPFFTTKPKGKGTGLGLSMIFGFVKRSQGHVKAYSELGVGTTFRLYLPRSLKQTSQSVSTRQTARALPRGSETILIVDDEKDLLEIAQSFLRQLGYKTLRATDGQSALQILEDKGDAIDLLFSDVVMPGGINGYELAGQAVKLFPPIKVLLTSGFPDQAMARNDEARFNTNLLNKPYSRTDLALHLRAVLDAPD